MTFRACARAATFPAPIRPSPDRWEEGEGGDVLPRNGTRKRIESRCKVGSNPDQGRDWERNSEPQLSIPVNIGLTPHPSRSNLRFFSRFLHLSVSLAAKVYKNRALFFFR
ncbi:hypothetical protein CDAR_594821 [Caerostris darwini]|uniref:Uncharacterized protein n=1 Tax=Caerostris darwini TaxID=1538125 RepID=A0AAV4PCN8_9ARAC|nr:hypothetical protein CDAR_594821 [Caerostris darwini]